MNVPETFEVSPDVNEDAKFKTSELNGDGHINIGGQFPGHYSRCTATVLSGDVAGGLNEFFVSNPGRLVVSITPLARDAILVLHTKTLSEKEIEALAKWGQKIQAEIDAEAAAEELQRADAEAEKEALAKENERLINVGRVCERAHLKGKESSDAP